MLLLLSLLAAADFSFRTQEIETGLGVGYAVCTADVNGDGLPDIVVVDTERVLWYENPSWQRHTLIESQTRRDNVCIAPHDIDGDGRIDFALGADWRPFDTQTGGTIQWLSRPDSGDGPWNVHPIGEEPTVHRLRWADLDGDGSPELVVVPLMGRGTTAPNWSESALRILAYKIPADPRRDPWPVEVIDENLHVAHNFHPTDLDRDGRLDLLVASFEGVTLLQRNSEDRWPRTLLGTGNQETTPNKGASEIKHGRLASGDYIATIEPWHGFQVVVYREPTKTDRSAADKLWTRTVLDEELLWGHAVWCADLDIDSDEELIVGVRDDKSEEHRSGVRIYDPQPDGSWSRHLLDAGGVAVEDLTAADLNADGRIDLIAAGRKTKNVRIYWNE